MPGSFCVQCVFCMACVYCGCQNYRAADARVSNHPSCVADCMDWQCHMKVEPGRRVSVRMLAYAIHIQASDRYLGSDMGIVGRLDRYHIDFVMSVKL
eukprot:2083534-Pleurochrysis_carterae.AAC.2